MTNIQEHAPLWVVGEGLAGTEKPALGLAYALGFPQPVVKRVMLREPWRTLSPWLGFEGAYCFMGDPVMPPWPRVVIASGRKSLAVLRVVKRNNPDLVGLYIQKPPIMDPCIDRCLVPLHDRPPMNDPRVIPVIGTLSSVDDDYLRAARDRFAPLFAHLPRPLRSVLIGGPNAVYRVDADTVIRTLKPLAGLEGGFAITLSRRSDPALQDRLRALFPMARTFIWDGGDPNPYPGFLACADYIYVTPDSVSMACEAAGTGTPLFLLPLPQKRASKFDRLHQSLIDHGAARWFDGSDKTWSYTPLREAARVARILHPLISVIGKN